MVYKSLDPTILQSKTCKKMNDVLKSLTHSLTKRRDTLTDEEIQMLKTARMISKMHRNANARIWGGISVAKKVRLQRNNEQK